MNIQPIKISSKVINSNQFIHGPNQFIQDMGPLAFEGQFDLTEYIKQFVEQYLEENPAGSKVFFSSAPASVTGTTALTITQSILIPANTVSSGDTLDISFRFNKTTALASIICRSAINTSNSNTGATQLSTVSFSSTQQFAQFQRTLHVISNTNTTTLLTSLGNTSDYTTSLNAPSSLSIDWTVDQYLFTTVQLGNAGDLINSQYLRLIQYKP